MINMDIKKLATDSTELIRKAVGAVLEDKGFRLPSVPATTIAALNTASQVIEWMNKLENKERMDTFSTAMVGQLKACLPKRAKLGKTDKEAMWRNYHQLRISPSFQSLWK